ncbi:MAG: hypothetical protein IJB23_00125 [Alistipes sp.]|mgnify:CR=1 FL=1|nr:hypothetical protein [Alistipes sp.]MBQ3208203.1 hypothetical protein [Alistipes sp.]MBQ6870539.1 hypothetical protein [Alistipes sp.]MBQ7952809.1 hypothetical protein [Alistipes sp.]MBQ9963478.1 hypothetical protein [Alistipes sp.]
MRVDRPFFVPLAITVVTAIIAALLFVSALVSWLAEFFGSFKEPCLLVGAFMAVIAFVVYQVSLKSYFKQISEELGVIYSVSRVIRGWLDWATALIGATNEKEGVD